MRIGIAGGSIIGCYLGYKLAKQGHEVSIFERSKQAKDVCSALVSTRFWDFVPRKESLSRNTLNSIVTHFPKKDVVIELDPPLLACTRGELNDYVEQLALQAGCKIEKGRSVSGAVVHSEDSASLIVDGSNLHFNRVIGCDGAASAVRRSLGIADPKFCMGLQATLSLAKESVDGKKDFAQVWPTKTGFAWAIPKGDHVELGILGEVGKVKEEAKEWTSKWQIEEKDLKASLIPSNIVSTLAKGPVALCGDAAGLTKPWSLGGIIWSMAAADILIESFPSFDDYSRRAGRLFRRKAFFSRTGYRLARKLPFLVPKNVSIDTDWGF
jgi:flavin-dependent dehydrogenase